MKKTLFVLCLTFASALILQGAVVSDTKNFEKIKKDGMPYRWSYNAGKTVKSKIKHHVKTDAKTGKRMFVVDLKALPRYSVPIIFTGTKCKAGDKIIITAKAKVSGSLTFKLYRYGKRLMKDSKPRSFRIMNRMTTIKAEFVMTDDPKDKLAKISAAMYLPGGKVTEFESIKVELIPAAAKK